MESVVPQEMENTGVSKKPVLWRLLEARQVSGGPAGTSVVWELDVYFPGVEILQQKADPPDLRDPLCWNKFATHVK